MQHEKSCGALVFRGISGKPAENRPEILLIRHSKGGHWSFPKGHVEPGETEEQTALREVFEETGLRVSLWPGFRESVVYSPKRGVSKEVVYFLGEYLGGEARRQESEIRELRWFGLKEACRRITFRNDISLIRKADALLKSADVLAAKKEEGSV